MQSKTFAPNNKEKQFEIYTNSKVNSWLNQKIKYKFLRDQEKQKQKKRNESHY